MADVGTPCGPGHEALLLRETNHRCANDLQLVVSLLALQSRRAESVETRTALADTMARVAILARTRVALGSEMEPELGSTLRQVCEALHSQAEPRGILISVTIAQTPPALAADRIATLALAVNELATNAIKHAFREEQGGRISIILHRHDGDEAIVTVDDDGLPLSGNVTTQGTGLGFGLVRRLIASVGGTFVPPADGTKRFEIRMPLQRR